MKKNIFKYLIGMLTTFTVSLILLSSTIVYADGEHSLGCIPDSEDTIREHLVPELSRGVGDPLPAAVDLTSKFPTPKDQGTQGSCTAWAVSYALKSYQEKYERGWDISLLSHQFSPSYVYNQINGGVDRGSSIGDAMDLIVNQGVCSLADMPYNANNYKTQPNSTQRSKAAYYKAESWNTIQGIDAVKRILAKGDGVVISIAVYPDFDNLSNSNQIYDVINGDIRGYHAICLIGYDDSKQAFKFINSWGPSVGINGYGYISYNMFLDSRISNGYGYIMNDIIDPYSYITQTISGDFNGDGKDDICKIMGVYGIAGQSDRIEFHVTLNGSNTSTVWRTNTQYDLRKIVDRVAAGDFNGDGKCDIAAMYKYDASPMQVHVFTSNGSSFNGWQSWYASSTVAGYDANKVTGRFVAGDFNGDGKCDIAAMYKYDTAPVQIHGFISNGSKFNDLQTWYVGSTVAGYDAAKVTGRFVAGDFNGDGKCDIAAMYKYDAAPVQIHGFLSNGSKFNSWQTWYVGSTVAGYDAAKGTGRFVAGDFNGDGKCDIAAMYKYDAAPVKIHGFISNGSKFNDLQTWYVGSTVAGYDANKVNGFVAGYFNKNASGKADVVANYNYLEGYSSYHYFESTGAAFRGWANWP